MPADNRAALRKKTFSETWRSIRWRVIGVLTFVTASSGFIGFYLFHLENGKEPWPLDVLYSTIQLFFLESDAIPEHPPWPLDVARFAAPAIAGYAAVIALLLIFRDEIQRVKLKRIKNHVLIVGLGDKGTMFAEGFQRLGFPMVLVERDQANERFNHFKRDGVLSLHGDATNPNVLKAAGVDRAAYLISVCGSDETNAEIAVHAREFVPTDRVLGLQCVIHLVEPQLCQLMRRQEMLASKKHVRMEFVNLYENAIQALASQYPFITSKERQKIIVIGLGQMGETLILHLARLSKVLQPNERLEVTVLDRAAQQKVDSMVLRYPYVDQICGFETHSMDVNSPDFLHAALLPNSAEAASTSIFVCLDNDSLSTSVALILRHHWRATQTPIYVRISRGSGLAKLLQSYGENLLRPFGSLSETWSPDMLNGLQDETLARAIHVQYVAKRMREGFDAQDVRAVTSWEDLPQDLKESNRRQARDIGAKLKVVGCDIVALTNGEVFKFTPEEVEQLSRLEHDRWMNEKLATGWTYGPVKDESKKETPFVVEYDRLTEEIKEYDRNAVRQIPQLLARVGFQIYRLK